MRCKECKRELNNKEGIILDENYYYYCSMLCRTHGEVIDVFSTKLKDPESFQRDIYHMTRFRLKEYSEQQIWDTCMQIFRALPTDIPNQHLDEAKTALQRIHSSRKMNAYNKEVLCDFLAIYEELAYRYEYQNGFSVNN